MEKLYATFLLWKHGFHAGEPYEDLLNAMFLIDSKNDFLLELEECSTNMLSDNRLFLSYWNHGKLKLEIPLFGKYLFSGLQHTYHADSTKIEDFGNKCYLLWQDLPPPLDRTEPFWTLCYADDPLSWGDEAQTKSLYEKAFAFYN